MVPSPRQPRLIAVVIGALALIAMPVGAVQAGSGPRPCRVRNVTQDTAGRSFPRMVEAAVDGDRLRVPGTCLARRVIVSKNITVRGVGDRRAVLDAAGEQRVLHIRRGAVVTLWRVVLTGGSGPGHDGGGVLNSGVVTLLDAVVRGNLAGKGAGIMNEGDLMLIGSVVRDNRAFAAGDGLNEGRGGGIYNRGALTVIDSVIRGNSGGLHGGGLVNHSGLHVATATFQGSVLRANSAKEGGGVFNHGAHATVTLVASSVVANRAVNAGGGFYNGGTVILVGSTVSENRGGGIYNEEGVLPPNSVVLDEASSVTGNRPYDCHGTTAC